MQFIQSGHESRLKQDAASKIPATEFAIEQPRVVALATMLALLYGILSYPDLPRQENPLLRERFAGIRAYLPGASPEQVELLVTKVIEEKVGEHDARHEFHAGRDEEGAEPGATAPGG